jgi:hypothetical protein
MKIKDALMNPTVPAQSLEFLVCDMTGRARRGSPGAPWAVSPILCLRRALEEGPRVVLVRFGAVNLRERAALVQLCAALRRPPPQRSPDVVALLPARHRGLMVDLQRAGVAYVRFGAHDRLDSRSVRGIIAGLAPEDRIAQRLAALCPYLHYQPIDFRRELTVCGAYRDRLVLGGRRLADICESDSHLACDYFLDPRSRP